MLIRCYQCFSGQQCDCSRVKFQAFFYRLPEFVVSCHLTKAKIITLLSRLCWLYTHSCVNTMYWFPLETYLQKRFFVYLLQCQLIKQCT